MIGIVETAVFTREAEAALNEEELNELKAFIASNPKAGVIVPGTSGARKLRWSAGGRGKRGGGRVVYYYHNDEAPVVLFRFFTKAAKADLSSTEKTALSKVVDSIKEELRRRK